MADISLILLELDIKPGSIVIEAGKILFKKKFERMNLLIIRNW
jgi:hypothetical protein